MSTPAAHIPTTTPDVNRTLAYLLAAALAAAAVLAIFVVGIPGDDPVPTTDPGNVREWTRTQLLDHLARVNGFAPSAAVPSAESARQSTLDELYRINGIFPAEPAVPAAVR